MTDSAHGYWIYAATLRNEETYVHRTTIPEGTVGSLCLFDPYLGLQGSALELERAVLDLPSSCLSVDQLVIRLAGVDLDAGAQALLDGVEEKIARLVGRAPSVFFLAFATPTANAPLVLRPNSRTDVVHPSLTRLRALELHAHLARTRAVHAVADAHFILPSGVHAAQYVRIGDALDDVAVVARLADWLQERLTSSTVLLADTYTILPLIQELARRPRRNEYSSRLSQFGGTLPLFTFPQYPSPKDFDAVIMSLRRLLTTVDAPHLLVVMSVTSTGHLLSEIRTAMQMALPNVVLDVVTLVSTEAAIPTADVVLSIPTDRYDVQLGVECRLCGDHLRSATIPIDRKKYTPEVMILHNRVMIKPNDASAHRQFWELADRCDAVAVHAQEDSTGIGRHLQIAIRVDRVLANRQGADAVERTLGEAVTDVDCVVVPRNQSTDELVRLARKLYPSARMAMMQRPPLSDPRSDEAREEYEQSRASLADAVSGARHILLLDEVVISGGTLRALHRMTQDVIRTMPEGAGPVADYKIFGFAVLARPQEAYEWSFLRDSLRQAPAMQFLGAQWVIPMPIGDCPWCGEVDRLRRAERWWLNERDRGTRESKVIDEALVSIRERLVVLEGQEGPDTDGLKGGLYLCDEEGDTQQRSASWISAHSLFGERLHEATAYAAVACAMHAIRRHSDEAASRNPGTVWGWDMARLINAYHDPLLQAAILRAAKPSELLLADAIRTAAAIEHALFTGTSLALTQTPLLAAEHLYAVISSTYPEPVRLGAEKAARPLLSSRAPKVLQLLTALREADGRPADTR